MVRPWCARAAGILHVPITAEHMAIRRPRQPDYRIGTSGWVYPHWRGLFYPDTLGKSSEKELAFLSRFFRSVEINATFYSLVRPSVCERWASLVPPGFLFAVKGSRFLTHNLRLQPSIEPLANFFAQGILLLGEKLGPILWQLPPRLAFDADRAERFMELLPRDFASAERLARRHDHRLAGRAATKTTDGKGRIRHAFEVRHPSWLTDGALRLLERKGVALVVADTADVHPFSLAQTADFVYVRLHGAARLYASRYTDAQLALWARRLRRWTKTRSPAFVYFDNDNRAYAPGDAERLSALLARRKPAAFSVDLGRHAQDRPDRFARVT